MSTVGVAPVHLALVHWAEVVVVGIGIHVARTIYGRRWAYHGIHSARDDSAAGFDIGARWRIHGGTEPAAAAAVEEGIPYRVAGEHARRSHSATLKRVALACCCCRWPTSSSCARGPWAQASRS
eukprot:scaffold1491_cov286-Prasinococcus_capsulatus_cf.AAC.2